VDLREQGSGVTGARNAGRLLGTRGFVLVLVLDTAKGAAAVWLARRLAPDAPWALLAAPAVVAGHIWPVWLKFKGGRGAATFMGVCFGLHPLIVPIAWAPGLILWMALRKGFVPRAVAFLASLPLGLWLVPGLVSRLCFTTAWLLVLLAHRSYFGKTLVG
jgi:glycerol-3-phosphate acyltransferase PlsY